MPQILEFYHDLDLKANQLFNSRLHNISTASRTTLGASLSTLDKGYMVYDTNVLKPFFWDGTTWQQAGGAIWGGIAGTLSNQTDLQNALNAKFNNPTGNTSQYIRGDGTLATLPTITPSGLTRINDTNVTLTLTGSPSTALLQNVNVTVGWNGTLDDSRITSANTWNAKQNPISLTTTGTSGAATFIGNTLNIPQYTDQYVGTVTSVAALTLGTTGTDFNSTVANGTTTPVITLNVPTASATNRGALSSVDWSTFNGKENVLTFSSPLSRSTNTISIPAATSSTDGYLTSANWSTFNNKQNALSGSGIVRSSTGTISYISGTNTQFVKADGSLDNNTYLTSAVTSVGLSTTATAFTISGSPVTGIGTLSFAANGTASQYIRGDGSLANFPTVGSGGGGSSVSYYLNGSVSQVTISGNTYYELSKDPVTTTPGTDFTINTDGIIARFITDAGDPALLSIPGGNWNIEFFFSASATGGTPSFYVNVYKYDGTTFTLIGSNVTASEGITNGTVVDSYFTAVSIPTTALTLTDRLAIEVYVNHSNRTITLHTEDNHLCQITTTFVKGITSLNGITDQVQNFQTGTLGSDFAINSTSTPGVHVFNLPVASATNTGKLSNTDYTNFNNKASKGFAVAMAAAL